MCAALLCGDVRRDRKSLDQGHAQRGAGRRAGGEPSLLGEGTRSLGGSGFEGELLELRLELGEIRARETGFRLVSRAGDGKVTVTLSAAGLEAAGTLVPAPLLGARDRIRLHAFFDRSVLELYVNGGEECVTCVVSMPLPARIEVFARGGSVEVREAQAWTLASMHSTDPGGASVRPVRR